MYQGRSSNQRPNSRSNQRARLAFTLVELLVVIGVIAVLIGILLPALSAAKTRAQTIACQSNLRQIYIAARTYATEFNDSLPFGMAFNKMNPNGRPAGGDTSYITWFSSCDKYMTKGAGFQIPIDGNSFYYDGSTKRKFSAAFRCPTVDPSFNQKIHYYNHGVAMPYMTLEMNTSLPTVAVRVRAPARFAQLYPENALFWDTPIWIDAGADAPSLFWLGAPQTSGGYTLACPELDDELISRPQYPELRYRGPQSDRFAQSTKQLRRPDGPIGWPTDEFLASLGYGALPGNADTAGNFGIWNFAFGGPRWRHNGNQDVNVIFADGSARALHLSKRLFKQDGIPYYENEFRRKYLMLKWPSNQKDSGKMPTDG